MFKLTNSGGIWSESVLYAFGSGTDGAYPFGAVVTDSARNLYGTAYQGGTYGWGTVFEVTP